MSNKLKIMDWYHLECDNNIYHSDIINDIYNELQDFITQNEFTLTVNEKEFKGKFIHFLYKYSTPTKYKYY